MEITSENLNQNELAVLQGLADGKRIKQISRELRLTPGTVTQYICYIREKLEVDTTYEAISVSIRRGIID